MVLENEINVFLKPSVFQHTKQSGVSNWKCERKKFATLMNHFTNNVRQWHYWEFFKIPLELRKHEVRETNTII